MTITAIHLLLALVAAVLSTWAIVPLYRSLVRAVRSQLTRVIIGALLSAVVPSLAGAITYGLSVTITHVSSILAQF